ncbi:MAG: DEAD/DEAH box helicase, partial [Vicinamibacterales bacterium]
GKTLTAFLWCLDRLMFGPAPVPARRCRVLYISPLKALAVDVERNLRAPLAGIAQVASHRGDRYLCPTIAIRTGDTPATDRTRFIRAPADILITTPESLYLMLTSKARDALRAVDTIIIDEIHALVPTKRGAHLALSIERLVARCDTPPQRIGLSATQRPLDEVARFLGGAETGATLKAPGAARRRRTARADGAGSKARTSLATEIDDEFTSHAGPVSYRPVTVIDAGQKKRLALRIEVPVEDMARLTTSTNSTGSGAPPSIWSAIHPRLLELIHSHRSTLLFVNSRRLAERLTGALNELAGELLVGSHHGSIARQQRADIEEQLKSGTLRALVATSSLELGIDMGAIDLVVQIEAPPTVASGLQRVGRSGHQIDAISEGIIFPKFRGDLVACAAVVKAMHDGAVEATRYPRNPLDVVAQQIVAMTSVDAWDVNQLLRTLRSAAPFAELGRSAFEGVLDMLSGRYPSDEFAQLRPRITWDRLENTVVARHGSKRVAIANGGTIPDRGLYGVFLVGTGPGARRVGELDEEMVFETPPGQTFVLGASTWRVEEITHDRVLVSPAPGEPGKMPFWKGDSAGRPLELGLAIGNLMRDVHRLPAPAAIDRLTREHDLDAMAAENLLQYLRDQAAATGVLPDADTVIIERVRDELGDWRICVLSPRGGRIHAPWAMAAAARIRERTGIDVETLWGDDGFVVRFPDVDTPPDPQLFIPDPDEVQALVVRQLGATALFAAKFRENAGRSLLLPKRRPGMRAPLWQQRKRAADLLAVASRYGSFPVLLETYRECLRDFFDMPALVDTLSTIRSGKVRIVTVDSERPSPFAASLLFSYVASFLYDGDAPLAERRAQALAVDQAQLRELLGDAELRALLDLEVMEAVEQQLQRLELTYRVKHADALHDLLLSLGDLSEQEIRARTVSPDVAETIAMLVSTGRVAALRVGRETRYVSVEDVARFRDALGSLLPRGIPDALLAPVSDPLGDLALRFARTHCPFTAATFASRYDLTLPVAEGVLVRLARDQRLLEGEFRPGGTHREWTDANVLRMIRRRTLAKLRHEVEPVDQAILSRFSTVWQGLAKRRQGADALLDAIEQLQGAPLPASLLETEILPARIEQYDPTDLDTLIAAGEVVWAGVEPLGERDGRVALYLTDHLAQLITPAAERATSANEPPTREAAILAALGEKGAMFFPSLHDAAGGGYPGESVRALWNLVWQGLVTNDTLHALRAFTRAPATTRRRSRPAPGPTFRSRRHAPPTTEGRWSLVNVPAVAIERGTAAKTAAALAKRTTARTAWATALTRQLLTRHGVLTREAVANESVAGGFGLIYPVVQAMEEAGRVRRGYFVSGLGATQFALPGAVDLLRSLRDAPELPEVVQMAATDPANPYGATLEWPTATGSAGRGPTRTVGATVILVDGALAGYLSRGDRQLTTWLPDVEPQRPRATRAVATALAGRARRGDDTPRGMLLEDIDGMPAAEHPLARALVETGFVIGAMGLAFTRR